MGGPETQWGTVLIDTHGQVCTHLDRLNAGTESGFALFPFSIRDMSQLCLVVVSLRDEVRPAHLFLSQSTVALETADIWFDICGHIASIVEQLVQRKTLCSHGRDVRRATHLCIVITGWPKITSTNARF